MPDTDILVSELNSASQINTTDLLLMTQPDGDAQTGYSSRKGTVLQVANKLLKDTEYTTDLPNFDNKSVFGALNEIHNGTYIYKENETPYQLRQTPITANRTLEKLIGVSCAFNQLVQNGNFVDTSNWNAFNSSYTSISASNNELVCTVLEVKNTIYENAVRQNLTTKANHVYFITNTIEVPKQSKVNVAYTSGLYKTKVVDVGVNVISDIFKAATVGSDVFFGIAEANNYSYAVNDVYKLSNCMLIDLTACFGSEVADYLYNLEQNTAGSGIALFRQLFPEDYYAYQTATLISSKPVSKVIKDSNDQTIAIYPLGGDELRGLLKVVDGQLVAYGDVKGSDGIIYRNFEERAYASGDESLPNAITDGTNTVVELTTPTTASGTPFTNPMLCGSTEEFTDSRTLKMFCGHDSLYYTSNFKYW